MNKAFRYVTPILPLLICLGAVDASGDVFSSPMEQIRAATEEVKALLENPDRTEATWQEVQKVIAPQFDWDYIARSILAKHWEEHKTRVSEFTEVMVPFIEHFYMRDIKPEEVKKSRVRYLAEKIDGDQAAVSTIWTDKRETDHPVVYKLHRLDGRWKIYDMNIEGLSLVANYRNQIDRTLFKLVNNFDELLEKMRAQIKTWKGRQ